MVVPRPNRSALRLTAITRRAPSARAADTGTGLTSAPSTSQRPPSRTGAKHAGQRIGGAQRLHQPPAREPDLVAGVDLGGDGGKARRQLLDLGAAERLGEPALRAARR